MKISVSKFQTLSSITGWSLQMYLVYGDLHTNGVIDLSPHGYVAEYLTQIYQLIIYQRVQPRMYVFK